MDDGGYVVVGSTWRFASRLYDVYLVRLDAEGNALWERTFGGEANDYGYDVRAATDGAFVVAGRTDSFGEANSSVYLLKVDGGGEVIWQRTYGEAGPHSHFARSVVEARDGGFVATGLSYLRRDGLERALADAFYILKADVQGNRLWERRIERGRLEQTSAIDETADGGFILAGGSGPDEEVPRLGMHVLRTDSAGVPRWEMRFPEVEPSSGRSVQTTRDGGYVIAGWASIPPSANWFSSSADAYVVRLAPEPPDAPFLRGDANRDGSVSLPDVVYVLQHLFLGGAAPGCLDAADGDDDGTIQISDAVYLVNFLFLGGSAPSPPYPDEGDDPTPDSLDCQETRPAE
jgi:hypothetical protein